MKNFKKAGILIAILVVPVLIFMFLKIFFVNEFIHLEIINPKVPSNCELNLVDEQHRVPNFEGLDQQGKPFSSQQWVGKVMVSNFVIATSEDQQLNFSMARALERFKNESDVVLLSYTSVAEDDSLNKIAELAETYKAPEKKWKFIQNEFAVNKDFASCAYGIDLEETKGELAAGTFVLSDWNGQIRGYYDGMDRKDINRMMDEIAILLLEYNKQKS